MVPFFFLIGITSVAWVVLHDWVVALRWGCFGMLMVTASAHFGSRRRDLIQMVPVEIPRPDRVVTATGVVEILAGCGLLIPQAAKPSSVVLACLFVAMFPANIVAARKKLMIGGRPAMNLGLRGALQVFFIVCVLLAGFGRYVQ